MSAIPPFLNAQEVDRDGYYQAATIPLSKLKDFTGYDQSALEPSFQRSLVNCNEIRSLLANSVAHDMTNRTLVDSRRREYHCTTVTKQEDIEMLQRTYDQFKIKSRPDDVRDTTGHHPYAREERHLCMRLVYEVFLECKSVPIELNRSAFSGRPYDVYVKDAGGNASYHLSNGYAQTHVCSPIISSSDVVRDATHQDNVRKRATTMLAAGGPSTRSLKSLLTGNTHFKCRSKSQHCPIRAPYLTFIHSTYDMTIGDIGASLDIAEAIGAYVVLHYTASISVSQKGMLAAQKGYWRKFKVGGKVYIKFAFDDSENSYVHDFATYTSLLHISRFMTPSGRHFVVHRRHAANGTVILHLVHDTRPYVPRELVLFHYVMEEDRGRVLLCTYRYDTTPKPGFAISIDDHVSPVVISLSKRFAEDMINYIRGIDATKLSTSRIAPAMSGMASRMTVGNTNVTVDDSFPNEHYVTVMMSLYFMVFRENYVGGKLLEILRKEEQKTRDRNQGSDNLAERYYMGFKRLLRAIFFPYNQRANGSLTAAHPGANEIMSINDIKDDGEELVDFSESPLARDNVVPAPLLKSIYKKLCDRTLHRSRYPIELLTGPRFLEVDDIIPEMFTDAGCRPSVTDEPYIFYPRLSAVVKNKVKWAVESILEDELQYDMPRAVYRHCSVVSTTSPVPGDGNCFFHSFIRLVNHHEDPHQIRLRLSKSQYLCAFTVDERKALVDLLMTQPVGGVIPPSGWVNGHVISLLCMEYAVSVCIHTQTAECCVYNADCPNRIHVLLLDKHYSPIVQRAHTSHIEVADLSDLTSLVDTRDDRDDFPLSVATMPFPRGGHQSVETIITDTFGDDLPQAMVASRTSCINSRMGPLGFDSAYALMLTAVFDKMRPDGASTSQPTAYLPHFQNALLVSDNDRSSPQYFCDVLHVRTMVARRVNRQASKSLTSVINAHLLNYSTSTSSYESAIDRLVSNYYDCVVINPVFYSDFLSPVNSTKHRIYVSASLTALKRLTLDGTFVVAVAAPLDAFSANLMLALTRVFTQVSYVVPTCSPEHSVWAFVLCTGFKSMSDSQFLELFGVFTDVDSSNFTRIISHVPSSMAVVFDSIHQRGLNRFITAMSNIEQCMASEHTSFVDNSAHNFMERFFPKRSDVHVGGSVTSWIRSFLRSTSDEPARVALPPVDIVPFSKTYFAAAFPGVSENKYGGAAFLESAKKSYVRYFVRTILDDMKKRRLVDPDSSVPMFEQIEDLLKPEVVVNKITFFDFYFLMNYLHYLVDPNFVMLRLDASSVFFERPVTTRDFMTSLEVLVARLADLVSRMPDLHGRFRFLSDGAKRICERVFVPGRISSFTPGALTIPKDPCPDPYIVPPSLTNVLPQYQAVVEKASSGVVSSMTIRDAIAKPRETLTRTDSTSSEEEEIGGGESSNDEVADYSIADMDRAVYTRGSYIRSASNASKKYDVIYDEFVNLTKTHVEKVVAMCDHLFTKTSTLPSFSATSRTDPARVAWSKDRFEFMTASDESTRPVVVRNNVVVSGDVSDLELLMSGGKTHVRYVYTGKGATGAFYDVERAKKLPESFVYMHALKVFTEKDILDVTNKVKKLQIDPSCTIGIVQAGPGCGKTYSIVETVKNVRFPTLVLTAVREGKLSLEERLRDVKNVTVRTVDSFIMHSSDTQRYTGVYIDEAMMVHPGKILLCIHLAKPNFVRCYGDVFQIPFVNRVSTTPGARYTKVSCTFPIVKILDVSYRCPRDVVLYLSDAYAREFKHFCKPPDGKSALRTKNMATCPSVSLVSIKSVSCVPTNIKDVVYLTFTHPDAEALSRHLHSPVSTIHEYQGNQAKHIAVVRLTPVPVPVDGGKDLFFQEGHVTTAISRHTETLTYYTVSRAKDGITKFFLESSNYQSTQLDTATDFV